MANERFQILRAVVEGVGSYGVDPTSTATDALYDVTCSVDDKTMTYARMVMDAYARPMRGDVVTGDSQTFTISQSLRGHKGGALTAADFAQYHHLLQGCGYIATFDTDHWTFQAPAKWIGTNSVRLEYWADGMYYVGAGARGAVKIKIDPGKPAMLNYVFEALWTDPVQQAAAPTFDYDTGTTGLEDTPPPIVTGAVLDFDPFGDAPGLGRGQVSNIEIDPRATTYTTSGASAGAGAVGLVRHIPPGSKEDPGGVITFDVEQGDGAAADDWTRRLLDQTIDRTAANLHLIIGAGAGKICTIQLGGIRVKSAARAVLGGGRLGYSVTCALLGTTGSTSEDDLIITAS